MGKRLRCAAVLGWEHVVGCVSAGMDAARFGTALQYSKMGQLILGVANEATPTACAQRAYDLLSGAGVPCSLVDNLRYRLWCKFIANVGLNQTCCAFGVNYAQLFGDQTSEAFRTYIGAMREVIAVGNAEGVPLTEADMNAYIQVALSLDPLSMPSMAQDRVNKNKTEVDEFSGVIIALAEKHGLWVPCNRYLNAAIKEIEAAY